MTFSSMLCQHEKNAGHNFYLFALGCTCFFLVCYLNYVLPPVNGSTIVTSALAQLALHLSFV